MTKTNLNTVYDDDLLTLIERLGLKEKFDNHQLKCKFTGEIITFENLYSIFPESGDIKFVCDKPEAIKLFSEYANEHTF
jgi:hypothetical protein